jgi:hypothetical protein
MISTIWIGPKFFYFVYSSKLLYQKNLASQKTLARLTLFMFIAALIMIIILQIVMSNGTFVLPDSWLAWIAVPALYLTLGLHSFELSIFGIAGINCKYITQALMEKEGLASSQGRV